MSKANTRDGGKNLRRSVYTPSRDRSRSDDRLGKEWRSLNAVLGLTGFFNPDRSTKDRHHDVQRLNPTSGAARPSAASIGARSSKFPLDSIYIMIYLTSQV
jgi:hypothetical protein